MPTFEKMRVSLAREEDLELLSEMGDENSFISRTEYLTASFKEPIKFVHNKSIYTFTPIDSPRGFAAGFFARERQVELRHEDLSNYFAEDHEPSLCVISLDKAQVVWMENNSFVGDPKRVLESFFEHLLHKTELRDWRAFVRYFERSETYWEVVHRHRSEIRKVTFKFVPPNAFEGFESAQQFYTAIQKEANSRSLKEVFEAPPGKLRLDGPLMTASAEVAEQGAGEREIRGAKNEILYSSSQGRVTEKVPDEDMPTVQSQGFVRRVIGRLFGDT